MIDQPLSRFTAVDTHDTNQAVFYLDTQAPLNDLASSAAHRFTVVRDLMDTLSTLNLKDIADCDLTRVTRGVHLLTREGCAVLEVIQWRTAQEACTPLNSTRA
ncbi:hypothetical protein BS643_26000 [Pseudomonas protegens]|uniref:hypothetical protein n=1 Tax=Pseudomonas TaxID=286 RepID=UPI000806FD07|nr:hypothetical protein [Pseudomonas protegens]OBZ26434.1 hypothetical protein BBH58_13535 [Pseudomonas protegens]OBZ29323.1 hypothetical protein BBH57_05385 [Pseudomonas protegens]OKK38764.1 hypothetical protein BS643_26000 [Pseudomonas protegens]OKK48515.1 hypothetical protein BS644_14155 [Pseudomonas protegens]OKK53486.1 hypothetical protein BS645_26895 [Pseudomonas protegens]